MKYRWFDQSHSRKSQNTYTQKNVFVDRKCLKCSCYNLAHLELSCNTITELYISSHWLSNQMHTFIK